MVKKWYVAAIDGLVQCSAVKMQWVWSACVDLELLPLRELKPVSRKRGRHADSWAHWFPQPISSGHIFPSGSRIFTPKNIPSRFGSCMDRYGRYVQSDVGYCHFLFWLSRSLRCGQAIEFASTLRLNDCNSWLNRNG